MQTFLPFPGFAESAECLDDRRLGKQRVETMQIMSVLTGRKVVDGIVVEFDPKGWVNHPAVRMWRGHEQALMSYQRAVCYEWRSNRSFMDTCLEKTASIAETFGPAFVVPGDPYAPAWLGDESFHRSHQSNLTRKLPEHYTAYWPSTPADLEYVWPV